MKKLFKPFIAVVLLISILQKSAIAQPILNETANSRDMDNHDNSGKWGLLGLLGLVGFVNLKKADRTGTYTTSHNPQNR